MFSTPVTMFGSNSTYSPSTTSYLFGGAFTSSSVSYAPGLKIMDYSGDSLVNEFNAWGTGFAGAVYGVLKNSAGQFYAYGAFTSFNGNTARRNLVRLNSDYTLDTSFNPAFNNTILDAILDPITEKIVCVGNFTQTTSGTTYNRIIRLNLDGTPDNTFASTTGFNASVTCIKWSWQFDRYYIGGAFTTYKGSQQHKFVIVDIDGYVISWPYPTSVTGQVNTLSVSDNGAVFVAGTFTQWGPYTAQCVLSFSATGVKTSWFDTGGFNSSVTSMVRLGAPEIGYTNYYVGNFTTFKGTQAPGIAKVDLGDLDVTFNPGTGFAGSAPNKIIIDSNNNLFVSGNFTSYNGNSVKGVVKINNVNGNIDTSLPLIQPNQTTGTSFYVEAIDDILYLGLQGSEYGNIYSPYFSEVSTNGNYIQNLGPSSSNLNGGFKKDDKYYIGGLATSYGPTTYGRVCRLNSDFTFDDTFNTGGTGANSNIIAIIPSIDDKLFIGGQFTVYNSTPKQVLAKLNLDGSIDSSFVQGGTGFNGLINGLNNDPDGKLMCVGNFTAYGSTAVRRVARLNSDGSLDTTFNTGGAGQAAGTPTKVFRMSDGSYLINSGTTTTTYNGTTVYRPYKLNSNGTLNTSVTFESTGVQFAIDPLDNIYVIGTFTTYKGVATPNIVKLDANGNVDTTFSTNVGTGPNVALTSIIYFDNKIYVSTNTLTSFNGVETVRVARLNLDGTVDTAFAKNNFSALPIFMMPR